MVKLAVKNFPHSQSICPGAWTLTNPCGVGAEGRVVCSSRFHVRLKFAAHDYKKELPKVVSQQLSLMTGSVLKHSLNCQVLSIVMTEGRFPFQG